MSVKKITIIIQIVFLINLSCTTKDNERFNSDSLIEIQLKMENQILDNLNSAYSDKFVSTVLLIREFNFNKEDVNLAKENLKKIEDIVMITDRFNEYLKHFISECTKSDSNLNALNDTYLGEVKYYLERIQDYQHKSSKENRYHLDSKEILSIEGQKRHILYLKSLQINTLSYAIYLMTKLELDILMLKFKSNKELEGNR